MTLKLTHEMRQALSQRPGQPLEFEDDETHKRYVLVAKEDLTGIVDEQLLAQLRIGFDQADRGEVGQWDVDSVLAEAHRRHADSGS